MKGQWILGLGWMCCLPVAATNDSLKTARTVTMEEVVVTGVGKKMEERLLPLTITTLDRETLTRRHDSDLLPTLVEQVPGLFITSKSVMGYSVSGGAAGGMTLRGIGGSPTTGLVVLIDGHPQYMGLMGHPLADAYQTMLADKVEVLRGPASVLYGSNAMGGVINIITRQPETDGSQTNVRLVGGSYGTVETEADYQARWGKWFSHVAGSWNRTDGHRQPMDFRQYGGYGKLGYIFSSHWKMSGDVNLTHFDASNPGTVETPLTDNRARVTRGMASVIADYQYERVSGGISLFYNWGRHRINDGYAKGNAPQKSLFHSRDVMAGVSWFETLNLSEQTRLTLGIDYARFGGKSWNRSILTGQDTPGVHKWLQETGVYAMLGQQLSEQLTLSAGLRYDYHSQTGGEWIPQGGFSWQLTPDATMKIMLSKGFRNPTIREMFMFPPQNPELKPERVMNYEWSFERRREGWRYGVHLFYLKADNLIQTRMFNGSPLNINSGTVENSGVELEASARVNKSWRLQTNYSYLRTSRPLLATPRQKVWMGVHYAARSWNFHTGLQYIDGYYTSVMAGKERKQAFALLNLSADYRLTKNLAIFVRGENLLAQSYELMEGYPMPRTTWMGGLNIHL